KSLHVTVLNLIIRYWPYAVPEEYKLLRHIFCRICEKPDTHIGNRLISSDPWDLLSIVETYTGVIGDPTTSPFYIEINNIVGIVDVIRKGPTTPIARAMGALFIAALDRCWLELTLPRLENGDVSSVLRLCSVGLSIAELLSSSAEKLMGNLLPVLAAEEGIDFVNLASNLIVLGIHQTLIQGEFQFLESFLDSFCTFIDFLELSLAKVKRIFKDGYRDWLEAVCWFKLREGLASSTDGPFVQLIDVCRDRWFLLGSTLG
ncbi:hypothetical protein FRC07_012314, partial [Ceratobasidium sp. 392]